MCFAWRLRVWLAWRQPRRPRRARSPTQRNHSRSEFPVAKEFLDSPGECAAEVVEKRPALMFGQAQTWGGCIDKTARGLFRVTEQALPKRQRIKFQGQAIDQRMPSVGRAAVHCPQKAPDHSLVTQRPELLELRLADPPARGGEILQQILRRKPPVQINQLPQLGAAGMA